MRDPAVPLAGHRHDVRIVRDVRYGSARIHATGRYGTPASCDLRLDVYGPADASGAAPRPGLLLAFGGAFHRGSRQDDAFTGDDGVTSTAMAAYCETFARRGYVAFSIDYRLAQTDPDPGDTPVLTDPANIPRSRVDTVRRMLGLAPATTQDLADAIEAATDDIVAAFAFVRSGARAWSVDPDRIAIGGFSAGARIALNAAYGARVPAAAVVAISGYLATPDLERYVTARVPQPPVVFFSADRDLDYVQAQAPVMQRHFERTGVRHEHWRVPGATHFYPATANVVRADGANSTVEEAIAAFLARVLT